MLPFSEKTSLMVLKLKKTAVIFVDHRAELSQSTKWAALKFFSEELPMTVKEPVFT